MSHLVQLRSFLEVYRSGSSSRAAERLGITQPAVSAHMRSLEAVLGKPLFTRRARGMEPTAVAHELARSIGGALDSVEAGLAAVKVRSSHLNGSVHLAGPAEFMGERITPALAELPALGLRVRLSTGGRERIYGLLSDGVADLAITASHPGERGYGFAELARERLLLVAAPDLVRRLNGRVPNAENLRCLPTVGYDEDLPLVRAYFQHVFGEEPELQATTTVPDLRVVRRLVQLGAGWSVLPDYLCAEDLEAGRLAMMGEPGFPPANSLYLAWDKSALRHPRIAFVKNHLLAFASRP